MAKTIRYTIDLSEEISDTVKRLSEEMGVPKSIVFRRALALFKVTQEAVRNGERVGVGRDGSDSLKKVFVY